MNVDPCSICGGTDLNLVDGYYYCVECGTQDVNVRETVVEHAVRADGTFALASSRRLRTVLKDGVEMSGEWHKWHTYNFILSGLADELIALGAAPSFKMKVLWVWTQYIKQFQVPDEGITGQIHNKEDLNKTKASIFDDEDESDADKDEEGPKATKKRRSGKIGKDINVVTKGVLLTILYIALNLDKSDVQLSHFSRFIKEGRISLSDLNKFVPKELNRKAIPHWRSFLCCTKVYSTNYIRTLAMTFFKKLDIGSPLVPDLRKIIDTYVKELCLPDEFKNLVFSLLNLLPCDFLEIDHTTQKAVVRTPDFESVAMSYVLVALKMCFGLDSDYELQLSDAVDKINYDENYLKSYRLGMNSEETDRLFSFREWCNYLQFRKTMLCKFYLPMAHQHNMNIDEQVFMEQLGERPKRKIELSDEVTMDILNKIPFNDDKQVIPKSEFPPSLTPMSAYTEVILKYVHEPELKLLLSEDFTKYSLKYACEYLKLPNSEGNLLKGVSEVNKTTKKDIVGTLTSKKADKTLVFVRNCENKNWLKTNPPTVDHVTKEEEENRDCDSDHGYISHIDSTSAEIEINIGVNTETIKNEAESDIKQEVIAEEDEDRPIFDDTFENVDVKEEEKDLVEPENVGNTSDFSNENFQDYNLSTARFNPETFNRELTIKALVLSACKKYKVPIPYPYKSGGPIKRKSTLVHIGAGESAPKRKKVFTMPGEAKREVSRILAAYYSKLEQDTLNEVSHHVDDIVRNLDTTQNQYDEDNEIESERSSNHLGSRILYEEDLEKLKSEEQNDEDENQMNESSVIEEGIDEVNLEELVRKSDPRFNEKTHDINQLYIKFRDEINLEGLLDFDDPETEKILKNKIKELRKKKVTICAKDLIKPKSHEESSDSEDVSQDEEDIQFLLEKKAQRSEKLQPLIKVESVKDFKYWCRHYTASSVRRNLDMTQRFDLELKENCPSSFNFVIHECAAILDCTAFSLYKSMQNLEQMLIVIAKKK